MRDKEEFAPFFFLFPFSLSYEDKRDSKESTEVAHKISGCSDVGLTKKIGHGPLQLSFCCHCSM